MLVPPPPAPFVFAFPLPEQLPVLADLIAAAAVDVPATTTIVDADYGLCPRLLRLFWAVVVSPERDLECKRL